MDNPLKALHPDQLSTGERVHDSDGTHHWAFGAIKGDYRIYLSYFFADAETPYDEVFATIFKGDDRIAPTLVSPDLDSVLQRLLDIMNPKHS
jgi:hypothetical protein